MTIAVLGLGNVLMGDDAFGPWVVRQLEARHRFPSRVRLLDLGTPGLDLHAYVRGLETLIAVDTLDADAPAGTVHLHRSWDRCRGANLRITAHDPTLAQALATAELTGEAPGALLLVGAVPQCVSPGIGLSGCVRAALPLAAAAILAELRRLGVTVMKRSAPQTPVVWWEDASRPAPVG